MFCPGAVLLCSPCPVALALGLASWRTPALICASQGRDLVNQARAQLGPTPTHVPWGQDDLCQAIGITSPLVIAQKC